MRKPPYVHPVDLSPDEIVALEPGGVVRAAERAVELGATGEEVCDAASEGWRGESPMPPAPSADRAALNSLRIRLALAVATHDACPLTVTAADDDDLIEHVTRLREEAKHCGGVGRVLAGLRGRVAMALGRPAAEDDDADLVVEVENLTRLVREAHDILSLYGAPGIGPNGTSEPVDRIRALINGSTAKICDLEGDSRGLKQANARLWGRMAAACVVFEAAEGDDLCDEMRAAAMRMLEVDIGR